jgi:hypothetical protein
LRHVWVLPRTNLGDVLNPRQFGQLSGQLRREGGFTVHIGTGQQPKTGIMVSDPPEQSEQRTSLQETHGPEIGAYARKHEQALQGPERHLGGWVKEDTKPKQAVLDRSTRYPETPLGESQAYVHTVANRQEAAWHLGRSEPIDNPAYEADPKRWIRRIQGQNVP